MSFCILKRKEVPKRNSNTYGITSKRHWSQLEEAPTVTTWDNLSIKQDSEKSTCEPKSTSPAYCREKEMEAVHSEDYQAMEMRNYRIKT